MENSKNNNKTLEKRLNHAMYTVRTQPHGCRFSLSSLATDTRKRNTILNPLYKTLKTSSIAAGLEAREIPVHCIHISTEDILMSVDETGALTLS